MNDTAVPTLENLLESSAATAEFKAASLKFRADQQPNPHIVFKRPAPAAKVIRAICGLLEAFPNLPIQKIELNARSGCSDFRGDLLVNGDKKFRFVWDCAWKARQMGWQDHFGDADQIRAAQTFGYRCFEKFEEVS